jgi:hypothetical protein
MDGSLPKKPCKTCKNKFHAGCLYKVIVKNSFESGAKLMFAWITVVPHQQFFQLSSMPNRDTFSVGLIYNIIILN